MDLRIRLIVPEADENTPEQRFGSDITGKKLLRILNGPPSDLRAALRERVDSWIDSGKIEGDPDDAEDFNLRGHAQSTGRRGETQQEKSRRISNAFLRVDPILQALPLMLRRVENIEHTPEGNFEIQFPTGLELPEGSTFTPAERDAEQIFAWLLLSPKTRRRIAKCRRCDKYVIKQRAPLRPYAKPFLCAMCLKYRRSETAARCVERKRRELDEKRVGSLRQALANFPDFDPNNPQMRRLLTREINRRLKRSERIRSTKWLSEKRLSSLANAKSAPSTS
jgi:hypothetical protein